VCFFINGVSYLAVLAALLGMTVVSRPRAHAQVHWRRGLREGVAYAYGFAPIRVILLTMCITSIVGSSYNVLLPEFAVHALRGDAGTLGMLSGAAGFGALAAAVYLASRSSVVGLGKWVLAGLALMGGGLVAFHWTRTLPFALPLLVLIGFGMMVVMAAGNTILQTISDEDKRSRVMSLFIVAFLGMAPIGSLLTGGLASALGPANTFLVNGALCLLCALWFSRRMPAMRAQVQPIYERLKLVPPVVRGIETASELKLATKE
jgi:MFS family permease